ncbi:GNAT family N-acetyltransferase [Fodinibius halophilus]|uniref:GNAT family N-acetyltransferase n=1 Tax=Fodinibius halophilus TaxID=1736908 RepID=A0A6M1TCZ7_9BACT|nr:GNAT family N-acetyltransferase [Fodinibius halophilus]NGP90273.1 GNAT family N-acetyltransferase [Fodinibius halophilus]
MDLDFNTCTLSDIELLSEVAKETFHETFADMNSSETMAAYLESAFNKEQLKKEISNPNSLFLFLYSNGELAGYLKVNENEAQTEFQDKDGLEIERIYLRKEFQGQGLGSTLLEKAISIANNRNKRYIWLGVWEHNEQAISFYEHKGFITIGSHSFLMGEEQQKDYIMRKELS